MAEVLHKAVTNIERGGRRTEAGETRAGVEPRPRAEKALDEILFCSAIIFRVRARVRTDASVELARQQPPAKRRITERAGDENVVADARRITTHHSPASFAQQRNRNRELTRARNITADNVGSASARGGSQASIDLVEHPRSHSAPDSEIYDAGSRASAHRGNVAQVDSQCALTKSVERSPSQVEVNAFDERIDGEKDRRARGRQDRAVIARPKD